MRQVQYSYVCSDHFLPSCYELNLRSKYIPIKSDNIAFFIGGRMNSPYVNRKEIDKHIPWCTKMWLKKLQSNQNILARKRKELYLSVKFI